jgi:thiazole synthase
MALGCDAVLVASAVTRRVSRMIAVAVRDMIRAGRLAYRAGRIPRRWHAEASTQSSASAAVTPLLGSW